MTEENGEMIPQIALSRASAVARARLARRVVDALRDLGAAAGLEAVAADWPVDDSVMPDYPVQPDFALRILDTKLQFVLLPAVDSSALGHTSVLQSIDSMLHAFPEAEACIAVADDDELTSRVVYSGMSIEPIASVSAGRQLSSKYPLRTLVADYLAMADPPWPSRPTRPQVETIDYRRRARALGAAAVEERSTAKGRVEERQHARRSLSQKDAAWAADLALRVAAGEILDAEALLAGDVK